MLWSAALSERTVSLPAAFRKAVGLAQGGEVVSDHVGQYYAAMNSFLGVASNAEQVKTGLGLTGHPPIPAVGV